MADMIIQILRTGDVLKDGTAIARLKDFFTREAWMMDYHFEAILSKLTLGNVKNWRIGSLKRPGCV